MFQQLLVSWFRKDHLHTTSGVIILFICLESTQLIVVLRSRRYTAAKLWNNHPNEIRLIKEYKLFVKEIKK